MGNYRREVSTESLKMVWQGGLGPTLCGLAALCLLEQALCRGAGVTARNVTGTDGSQAKVWSSLLEYSGIRGGSAVHTVPEVGRTHAVLEKHG